MKINKNVLKLLADNAKPAAVYNLLIALIGHIENDYLAYDKINNIFNIITGETIINKANVNVDTCVDINRNWLYKDDTYKILDNSFDVFKVDNISGEIIINYKYVNSNDPEHKEYNSSFSVNFFEHPNTINIFDYESIAFKV